MIQLETRFIELETKYKALQTLEVINEEILYERYSKAFQKYVFSHIPSTFKEEHKELLIRLKNKWTESSF